MVLAPVPTIGCSEIPLPSVFAFAPYRKFAPLKVKAQQSVPSWMAVKIAAPPSRFNFLCFNCTHKNLPITAGLKLRTLKIYPPPVRRPSFTRLSICYVVIQREKCANLDLANAAKSPDSPKRQSQNFAPAEL